MCLEAGDDQRKWCPSDRRTTSNNHGTGKAGVRAACHRSNFEETSLELQKGQVAPSGHRISRMVQKHLASSINSWMLNIGSSFTARFRLRDTMGFLSKIIIKAARSGHPVL